MSNRIARKNQATAEAIITAARELMHEHGVQAVTLEAIAERADVAVQTIYNRVGGRNAVLLAVAEQAYDATRRYLDEAYASEGTVSDRLMRVAFAYVMFGVNRPQEFRWLAFPPPDAPAQDRVVAMVQEQTGRLADLLRQGVADGTVHRHIDPDLTALVLWRMWDGVISLTFRNDTLRRTPDQILPLTLAVADILESGLFTEPQGFRQRLVLPAPKRPPGTGQGGGG